MIQRKFQRQAGVLSLALTLLFLAQATALCEESLLITENGKSKFRILLREEAKAIDEKAAQVLQKYIEEISGARLPIERFQRFKLDNSIFIYSGGPSDEGLTDEFPDGPRYGLEEDGYILRTGKTFLLIWGGTDKGSLYGVYTLLEKYLGCRKYRSTVTVIPKEPTIHLPKIFETYTPPFTFRQVHYKDAYDPEYADWHKLDDGNQVRYLSWKTRVHTFRHLVSPDEFFKVHPEYFSMINGKRIPDKQLCLSNHGVFRIVVSKLRAMMEKNPSVKYWSVSQNDTYGNCQCSSCKAIDEKEGTPMGSLLTFVNKVAAEFPDKIISTLAYQYSRKAPKNIRPAKNVCITLCSIECNRSKPLVTDPSSASFRKDLEDWSEIASHIFIWDYVVQFRNLVSPFPNLRVLQSNLIFFLANEARAMFQQGAGRNRAEFSELRTYLIAKLLWDPYVDIKSVMDDFLQGFYGPAAKHIREYIDVMHDALGASGQNLLIYGYPHRRNRYLSPSLMDRYHRLFDKAEEAVKDVPEFLARVEAARLPLQFATLEHAKEYGTGSRGYFRMIEHGKWEVKPEMKRMLSEFVEGCSSSGIALVEEHGTTPADYAEATNRFLKKGMNSHLALFKPVTLKSPASPKYPSGGEFALTDGLKGLEDYNMHWVGFEGEDMEAIIDLGEMQTIRKVSTDFLQAVHAWVFLPAEVRYSLSRDGKAFGKPVVLEKRAPEKQDGTFIETFSGAFADGQARFIKVQAMSMKTCPDWHVGHGGKAWIFADEIVVE